MAACPLSKLEISGEIVAYDRLSDKSQVASFNVHVPIIEAYAQKLGLFATLTEVGSAYTEDYRKLELCSLLTKKDLVLVVYSADRICRNLALAGMIEEAIRRNNLTIHIVGVERPYICSMEHGNIDRLKDEMRAARDESQMKSERAIRTYRHKQVLKLQQPFVPPTASAEVMDVLSKMINGCPIDHFYKAFNKITPYGATDDRLGGPNYILEDRNRKEFTQIKRGDFTLKDILAFFNKWEVYQKGKTNWTMATLSDLISHHFGLPSEMPSDEMKD
jgi:hypothetical protein